MRPTDTLRACVHRTLRTRWAPGPLILLVALATLLGWAAPEAAFAQGRRASNVLYLTTNDPTPGQNAILTFRRSSGTLTFLGRFAMGGTGAGNPEARLGTLDSDQNVIASPDRRFLFAVNSGSDSIAVFRIRPDGALVPVPGSPFPSGGHMPVSVGLRGEVLFVVNKNEIAGEDPFGFPPPNYTAFRVLPAGRLVPIPNATISVANGSSPSQALISNDGRFLFDGQPLVNFPTDFAFGPGAGGGNSLQAFRIQPGGRLTHVQSLRLPEPDSAFPDPLGFLDPNAPNFSGTTNGALGLQVHPARNILYVGFAVRSQMGVYTWDRRTGALTLRNVVGNSGNVLCWIQVSRDGSHLYTSNQVSNSLSRYSLADPLAPVEVAHLVLRTPPGADGQPTPLALSSQEWLAPAGDVLYSIGQKNIDADDTRNALHIIRTPPDGGLEEVPGSPIDLGAPSFNLPPSARPQGVIAF